MHGFRLSSSRRALRFIAALLLGATACIVGFGAVGFRINLTPSYPLGIWRIHKDARPKKGDFVLFPFPADNALYSTATARGYLKRAAWGFAPLLKKLAATAGDEVVITDQIAINGHAWENGTIRTHDSKGRPILSVALSGVVADGDCWVLSDYNPRTFDSRYFGPIRASSIIATATPILILNGEF